MENKNCPRCIEEWFHGDVACKGHKGTKEKSHCPDCGVCVECEHLIECKNSE